MTTLRAKYNKQKIIGLIYTDLYNAIYIEDDLQEINNSKSIEPKSKFSGHTECFSENMQKIKEYLKENNLILL